MIVSDTSPLNYLILIEAAVLLPRLYDRVLIPPEVVVELTRPETPSPVRRWVEQRPIWLDVVTPASPSGDDLSHLGAGEAQAITLALEYRVEVLLLDERDGTATARALGLAVIGTLGVLDSAARLGWGGSPHDVRPSADDNLPLARPLDGSHVGAGCDSKPTPREDGTIKES